MMGWRLESHSSVRRQPETHPDRNRLERYAKNMDITRSEKFMSIEERVKNGWESERVTNMSDQWVPRDVLNGQPEQALDEADQKVQSPPTAIMELIASWPKADQQALFEFMHKSLDCRIYRD